MKRVNVALIGCGYWGSKLKRYIEEDDSFSLVKVCNSKSNLDEVYLDKTILAVVVATPMETHFSIVRAALNSKKNVLCEKPLALTAEQCEKLERTARSRNRGLMVDYTFSFSRSLIEAQKMVRGGEIGRVVGLDLAMRQWGRFDRGGAHWLLSSHLLAILDMFVPLRDLVFAKVTKNNKEDEVKASILPFQGVGVSGLINVSLRYPGKERKVIVYGENGTLVYDGVGQPSLRVMRDEGYIREWSFNEADNLRLVIGEFAKVVSGEVESNVARAVVVTRVIEKLGLDKNG